MKKLFLVLIVFSSAICFAEEEKKPQPAIWWLDLSLALIAQSHTVEKGALIWQGPSLLPGIGVDLFNKLKIRGPRVTWSQFDRRSPYHLEITTLRFDDGAPWIKLTDEEKSYRNLRDPVWESSVEFRYKFGFRNNFYVGAKFAHAWNEYESAYYEAQLGAPAIPFVQLELAAGFMLEKTALYYYGPGAKSGLAHITASLKHVIFELPWNGIIMNQLSYSYLPTEENQEAFFIRGQHSNLYWRGMIAWEFL